ncbi:uncharacterized protein LOC131054791 isoform X1 [Cryptomeria japonica]|uniref:uncharacterized protein LOC131054791 isoform X1 n=1 Tax=Cryptomeria japonica TaxID=3369 RepID=UPI0025ACF41C|nr:uncharacterized protein LOC131054791 isoform X1 [Cryptomeria japonica]
MCSTASLILFYILHFSSIVATNAEDEDFWKLHEISSTEALIFYFGGSSQVCFLMNIERNKLLRFLKDGRATMSVEMQDGYEWARLAENQTSFDKAVKKLIKDLRDNRHPPFNRIEMCSQILARKKVAWMEGEQGWTTWLED